MRLRHLASLLVGVAVPTLTFSCGSSQTGENVDGTGGNAEPESECGSDLEVTAVAGTGIGAVFTAFQEGDPLAPYFGSQAGMEVDVSVLLTGYERGNLDSIEVSLDVDGSPIGFDAFSPRDLYCEDDTATIETPILIDVTDHPTVTSVAQLNGREAEIVVTVISNGSQENSSVTVILEI